MIKLELIKLLNKYQKTKWYNFLEDKIITFFVGSAILNILHFKLNFKYILYIFKVFKKKLFAKRLTEWIHKY